MDAAAFYQEAKAEDDPPAPAHLPLQQWHPASMLRA